MLTTTHMLVAAAAATRPKMPGWMITLGWLGGFAPDASVFLMVASARLTGMGGGNLWRAPDGLYWQEPWQAFSAFSNSIPLWMSLSLAGLYGWRRLAGRWRLAGLALLVFAVGALLHVLLDFPVHTDDAHVHFWPFSDWRFYSPVSYYQRDHYGDMVGLIEMVAGLGLAVFLFLRFQRWTVRILAAVMCVPYLISIGFLF